jgi:hypothetical protein
MYDKVYIDKAKGKGVTLLAQTVMTKDGPRLLEPGDYIDDFNSIDTEKVERLLRKLQKHLEKHPLKTLLSWTVVGTTRR